MPICQAGLLKFFESELALDVTEIDANTPLCTSGMVDSFALVSLIVFIEKEAGLRMRPIDVNLDHLDSIEKILRYCDQQNREDQG